MIKLTIQKNGDYYVTNFIMLLWLTACSQEDIIEAEVMYNAFRVAACDVNPQCRYVTEKVEDMNASSGICAQDQ